MATHFPLRGSLLCALLAGCGDPSDTGECTSDCSSSGTTGDASSGTSASGSEGSTTSANESSTSPESAGTSTTESSSSDTSSSSTSSAEETEASTLGDTSEDAAETSATGDPDDPSSSRMTAVPLGTSAANLGYWEYLPPDYDEGSSPLLVFFHGAMWQGDGSETDLQALLDVGPPNLISTDAWPNDRPFVVLSPQYQGSCDDADAVATFLQFAVDTYDVDRARIYLTGQSCGAMRSWAYLGEHLDALVTAAVLISGDGRAAVDAAGCDLGRVSIWGFHNEEDGSVDADGTIVPIETLQQCEPTPDVELTIYPDATEHDAWTKTYDLSAGHDIYAWFLERSHP